MELREKLVQLRALLGERRGLGRPMTQTEVAQALRDEQCISLSQAYLSQLERGKRVHLSNTSREALARFFQVHPGYLVNDLDDLAEQAWSFPAFPPAYAATHGKSEALQEVPGLALAADLSRPIQAMQAAALFPPSEWHDKKLLPATSTALPPSEPTGFDFAHWQPTSSTPELEHRLNVLTEHLRRHPEYERTLALMEHIVQLAPDKFQQLETSLAHLVHIEAKRRG